MLAIGDVCGKGTQAAVLTGVVRSTIRALALGLPNEAASPAAVLGGVNAALLREEGATALATAACALLRPDVRGGFTATLCAGGHPPALVLRAGGGVEAVDAPGRMLGVGPDPDLVPTDVRLAPGDLLLLYTDGILDARSGRETFGEERLREALAGCRDRPAATTLRAIDDAVRAFSPGRPRDDKALFAVRVPAA
jgi:serine phosphatase RsbU (regulator of sigma subunit)